MKLSSLLLLAALFFAEAATAVIPTITSVSPATGSVAGGNTVQIIGSGFATATAVDFGSIIAATFTIESDTSITLAAPESFVAGTIDVTVTNPSGTSHAESSDQYTYIDGDWYAYVSLFADQGAPCFLPVNLRTGQPGTILTQLNYPNDIAVTPDGQLALTVDIPASGLDALLYIYNLATLQPPSSEGLSNDQLYSVAITPDGTTAYIAGEMFTVNGRIVPFDIVSRTFGAPITFPPSAFYTIDLAITPDGLTAYVLTDSTNVFPTDLATGQLGNPIFCQFAGVIRITPDGTKLFLTNEGDNNAYYIDLTTNPPTLHNLQVGAPTTSLAINPNGQFAYFLDANTGNVIVVDIATLTISRVVEMPFTTAGSIAITPDGKTAYISVANQTSSLLPLDLTTYEFGIVIPLPNFGNYLVISPDQAPIASFAISPRPAGTPTTFDASMSISPVGNIANYLWDFGDGDTLNTSSPAAMHNYILPGNYTVTLTVTNTGGTSTTQTFTGQMASNNGGPSARTSQTVQIPELFPPQDVRGFQVGNKFLMQEEFNNIIIWKAPTQGNQPVEYNIYSDESLMNLIGVIPADDKLKFVQHNVFRKPYTYYLTSIDAMGNQSASVSISIIGACK